jgi:8-oxo-dGTP diphosphatase
VLEYTLAFILNDGDVLMLRRSKAPNAWQLNGTGGKIESGETPYQSILREVREEIGVAVRGLRFTGTVTWEGEDRDGGMYVYVGFWPEDVDPSTVSGKRTREGTLEWFPIDQIAAGAGGTVVDNIPRFLPQMLNSMDNGAPAQGHHCRYEGGKLVKVNREPLSFLTVAEATA